MSYAVDGEEGAHWATHAERYDAGMRAHAALLAEAARIAPVNTCSTSAAATV